MLMEKSGKVVSKTSDSDEGVKSLVSLIAGLKGQLGKRLDDLKTEMTAGFELNSNALLESKFNERLADAVTALTR
jgi:hypothetical protein